MLHGYTEILSRGIYNRYSFTHIVSDDYFICLKIWQSASKDRELEGKVVDCLKQNFVAKKPLTQSCSDHLTVIMEQQALHYQLDPVLVNLCDKEVYFYIVSNENLVSPLLFQIQIHCGPEEPENTRQGQVEECLKRKFDTLTSVECRRHVALLITAVQIDIQADPMLHRACAIDLVTFCKDVPPGDGRSTFSVFIIIFRKPFEYSYSYQD